MAGYNSFYKGGLYGAGENESVTEDYFLDLGYKVPASNFGSTTDARTSNQIKAVSDKISTGLKAVEVTAIDPGVLEYIPKQHLDEINRLKKLVGIDLTFHGPLIEPTGISKQGWDDSQRLEAERKIKSAIEKGHQLDPDGNVVVTFHSGVVNLEPEQRVFDEKKKKEILTDVWFVDEQEGSFGNIPLMKKDYFPGEEKEMGSIEKANDAIRKRNEETWSNELQNLNFHVYQGAEILKRALKPIGEDEKTKEKPEELLDYYKNYGTLEVQNQLSALGKDGEKINQKMQEIAHGDIYVRDAYVKLKKLFNEAYSSAERKKNETGDDYDLRILNTYKKEIAPIVKDFDDPRNIEKLSNEVVKGVNVLRTLSPPERYRPLKDFMIDKASETFSNAALHSYDKFKDSAPIISIENAPAGTAPLSRAEDLKKLIEETREKFVQKAQEKFHMSKDTAKKQAEKLIGATWDIGHINMIRRFGYDEKEVVKESKKIAPFVKHVHLSDNFGIEHTELPMGMGNVPTKKIMELHDNFKKAKKIIETGGWYKDFKITPFRETLSAFGSPLYSMKMAPAWNQASFMSGGYFAGYGNNPDIHHSIYGAGFSGLPVSLGGQIEGRSRVSGAPIE